MNAEELRARLSSATSVACLNKLAAEEIDRYGDYDDEDLLENTDSCFLLCVDGGSTYLWVGSAFASCAGKDGVERAREYADVLLQLIATKEGSKHASLEMESEGNESEEFWKIFEDGY